MPAYWSKKDERQYKAVVRSCRGGKRRCKSMAAAIVNKRRALEGRAKTISCRCPKGYRKMKSAPDFCFSKKLRKRVKRCHKKKR